MSTYCPPPFPRSRRLLDNSHLFKISSSSSGCPLRAQPCSSTGIMATTNRLSALLLSLFLILQLLSLAVSAQDCSKTKLCSIGCCSKDGFCGTTPDHCGSGCLSTCDYKPAVTECSAKKLCATGCCSKDGFCGTTPAHCGSGCQSTCDFNLGCDKSNPCKDGSCCSKFGFCGFGPDCKSPRYAELTPDAVY